MRDLLTGLAIILIVALTTALVAPYLVDWNGQRAFLEARLSHALGQKVTIGGDIDLKLLPTPYLVLDQTVIGSDDGPIRIGIHHLDLQLSVTPLLHGEFDIIEAQLREPTLRVSLQQDRSLPALPDAPAFEANLRFDKIVVDDGTIAIADPESGRTFVLDHLDFTADAPSLKGPFRGDGVEGQAPRTKFRFATTAAQNGRARAHLVIDETSGHAGLDLDGLMTLAHAEPGTVEPSFAGTVSLASHLSAGQDQSVAWTLSGPLTADRTHADLAAGALRIGSEDAGLTLQADGHADFGATPSLALDLSAKQLDIDRLSGAPADATQPVPPKLPDLAALRRLLAEATPPVPLALDVKVAAATYGAETLSDLAATLVLGGGGPQPLHLSGEGPGGLHLALDGQLPQGRAGFDGTFALGADDVPTALAWWAMVAPDRALAAADLPIAMVRAKGTVASTGDGIALTNLALTLDRSDLTGHADLAYAKGAQPARLAANVTAQALDLDALPNLDGLRGPATPLDLDLTLEADTLKVAQVGGGGSGGTGAGELDAGHLRVALTKTGRHIAVTRFDADNLGGATIEASGSLDPDKAAFTANVDAGSLNEAAIAVKRLLPGRIADAFAARAPALAPAKLHVTAAFAADEAGKLAATRLDVGGRLAATNVEAHLAPDAGGGGALSLTASADAPEGSTLLAQLGFETLPLDLLGHSRVALTAHGAAGHALDTSIDAAFGGTRLTSAGVFDWLGAAQGGSGTIAIKGDDIGPLLQSLALAFPDMTGRIPIDLTGAVAVAGPGIALSNLAGTIDGIAMNGALKWQHADADAPVLTGALDLDRLTLPGLFGLALGPPQATVPGERLSKLPFTSGLIDPPRSAIKLKAKALDFGIGSVATDAVVELGVAPNVVTLHGLEADFDGGRIRADATLRRDGNQAAVEGKIAADGLAIRWPSLAARLTGSLDVAGSGASAFALASSLAGSGDATLAGTTVPGADPAALPQIFDEVERDDLSVDAESIARALDDTIKGPLAAGSRRWHLGLASGSLHAAAADAPVVTGGVSSTTDTTLDLATGSIDQTTTETLQALPKGWTGPPPEIAITWSGPLAAPVRSFDVTNFLNAVAARALARETARIEAYEFDIRERAFFNARLNSERRRESDRLKAEDDARKAEVDRIAAKKAADAAAAAAAAEAAAPPEVARPPDAAPRVPPPAETRRFETPSQGVPSDPSAAGRY